METIVPLLPCTSLTATLEFYESLGFAITHQQKSPYVYAAVRLNEIELHFSTLSVYGAKNAFGSALVLVSDVHCYHMQFAVGLRTRYGRIPTANLPRLTRLKRAHTRFKVFDPSGNMLIFINRDEPEIEYGEHDMTMSVLEQALDNAVFLRDTYANDTAAAKVLDAALAQNGDASPIERARVLAARAELAVALGQVEESRRLRERLAQISFSDEERVLYREELAAADALELWIRDQTWQGHLEK